jgi:hypothetical protein
MNMPPAALHIFGVRHHGPGSARSLRKVLESLKPDMVLLEGPPDAQEIVTLAKHEDMNPPVAMLVYATEEPRKAVYYPFATFSPEWQAIQYALKQDVPLRFMDLPQFHRLGIEPEIPAEAPPPSPDEADATPEAQEKPEPGQPMLRRDPLRALAEAAGYSDSERWWEHMVEHRRNARDLFDGILEAMAALREKADVPEDAIDLQREAYMRQTIRSAQKEGYERIAIVCGAWHAPVLTDPDKDFSAKSDAALLKDLPKVKTSATWVPWTYSRLTFWSGYGAGVESPGWYHHLWTHPDETTVRWMTRIARLLRDEDIDCSSSHVIESVRLAETLAALRQRPLPGLPELNDAARSVFLFDNDLPMRLIAEKLIVGERLGDVPGDAPAVPLQQDVQREQKRLRLKPEATAKTLDLDLRNATDLDRSRLLHRLRLLGIEWGTPQRHSGGKGTFHELWDLHWQPEFSVSIIEAGVWGNTVLDASTAFTRDAVNKAPDLPALTELLDRVILADLPDAVSHLMWRLETQAAIASDVNHLMDALPPLARIMRYGNVRQTDAGMVAHAVDGIVVRVCVGLPGACASLNDDAAEAMYGRIVGVHGAVTMLQKPEHTEQWHGTLLHLADQQNLHGLVAGRATRLLLDVNQIDAADAARRMSLALSAASDPAQAAAWSEGFLKGSGLLLLHDEALWNVIDEWVSRLPNETFEQLLPLIRRTFATFQPPERRQMGERVKRGRAAAPARPTADGGDIDTRRAERVLPLLAQLLGLAPEAKHG